jgi:DNA-binding GntR family transcriptional regulator
MWIFEALCRLDILIPTLYNIFYNFQGTNRGISKEKIIKPQDASVRKDYHTIYDLVFNSLLEDILSGRIKPGEKLRIDEISNRLGVSRTPIREALKQLVSAGLVENEAHRSPFVKKLSIEEIIELYCIRAALDGIASRLAAYHFTDEGINSLEELCKVMESLSEASQYAETLDANRQFHSSIYKAAGSPRLQELCLQFYRNSEQSRNLSMDIPGSHAEICAEHREIVKAFRLHDGEAADHATRLHYFNVARRIAKSVGRHSIQL